MSFEIGMNIHRAGGVFEAYPFDDISKNIKHLHKINYCSKLFSYRLFCVTFSYG